jgi:hypothetical protein
MIYIVPPVGDAFRRVEAIARERPSEGPGAVRIRMPTVQAAAHYHARHPGQGAARAPRADENSSRPRRGPEGTRSDRSAVHDRKDQVEPPPLATPGADSDSHWLERTRLNSIYAAFAAVGAGAVALAVNDYGALGRLKAGVKWLMSPKPAEMPAKRPAHRPPEVPAGPQPASAAERRLQRRQTQPKTRAAMSEAERRHRDQERADRLDNARRAREEAAAAADRKEPVRAAAQSPVWPDTPEKMRDHVDVLFTGRTKDARTAWLEREGRACLRSAIDDAGKPAVAASLLCALAQHLNSANKLSTAVKQLKLSLDDYARLKASLDRAGEAGLLEQLKSFDKLAQEGLSKAPPQAAFQGPRPRRREDKREVRSENPEVRPRAILDEDEIGRSLVEERRTQVFGKARELMDSLPDTLWAADRGQIFLGASAANGLRLHVLGNGALSFKRSDGKHTQIVFHGAYVNGSVQRVFDDLDLRIPGHQAQLALLMWLQGDEREPAAIMEWIAGQAARSPDL